MSLELGPGGEWSEPAAEPADSGRPAAAAARTCPAGPPGGHAARARHGGQRPDAAAGRGRQLRAALDARWIDGIDGHPIRREADRPGRGADPPGADPGLARLRRSRTRRRRARLCGCWPTPSPTSPGSEFGLLQGQRGILLRRSGRDGEAAAAYGRALASFDPDRQPLQYARVRLNRSMMHLAAVRLEAARADLDSCLTIADAHDLPLMAAKARHNLGLLDFVAGDLPSALGAFRVAAAEYTERAPGMLPQLSLDRARALVAAGLLTDAEAELRQVVRRLAGQRLEQDLAEAHLALAEVALLAERPADVRPHARRALVILRRRGNLRWAARARLLELRAALLVGRSGSLTARFRHLATDCRAVGLPEEARVAEILAGRAARRAGSALASGVRPRPRTGDRLDTRLLWSLTRAEADLAAGRTGQLDGRWPGGWPSCTSNAVGWALSISGRVPRSTAEPSLGWASPPLSRTAGRRRSCTGASCPGRKPCCCRRSVRRLSPRSQRCWPSSAAST